MKNLHNLGLSDIQMAAKFYEAVYNLTEIRFNGLILQCKSQRTGKWNDVSAYDLDILIKKWKEAGSPRL